MDERPWTRRDWGLIALLALLAAAAHLWQLTHTEVASRDSIGFIRVAWQLHQAPLADWPDVLAYAEQHPLYPLWLLAVSQFVQPFHPGPTASLMQFSAQLASALAAVLLVLPMYALGRELFDRRVGFLSALLIQCLPVSGHLLADGLSEATFLLFAVSALYWGVRALRCTQGANAPRSPFLLAGCASALAYLTRPEGAFIVAAIGLVLLGGQMVTSWRRSTRDLLACGAALAVPALLLAAPFIAITGKLTVKPTGNIILKAHQPTAQREALPADSGILLAVYDINKPMSERFLWSFGVLAAELVKGSFYAGWLAALLGIWWSRDRFRRQPGAWMLLLVCLGVLVALWRVVLLVGYLSDRHTLLILVCLTPWAMAGLVATGERLTRRWPRLSAANWVLPLGFILAGLPKTMEPLHWHRAGLRQAGFWLAEHTHPLDKVTDPLCWSHYYAGRVFLEGTTWPAPPGYRPREFVVIEEAGNAHPRLASYQEAQQKAKKGELVYCWKGRRGKKTVEVHIYALPLTAG